jgi:transcription elongation factor GreA
MQHEVVLTPAKYKEIEAEIQSLLSNERPAIAERIRQARELGDLSENFDYQDAKRQAGLIQGRINNLKKMLEVAYVTEYQTGSEIVSLGSVVTLYDEEYDEDIEYTIVGVLDADPAQNRISNSSPVGSALMGKKVGETVEVPTPAGRAIYKIKAVL